MFGQDVELRIESQRVHPTLILPLTGMRWTKHWLLLLMMMLLGADVSRCCSHATIRVATISITATTISGRGDQACQLFG